MKRLRLSVAAERNLALIFAASEDRFGRAAADRYRRLVSIALRDLRADCARAGVQSGGRSGVQLYHLRHSRRRSPRAQVVARPRRLLAFRIVEGEIVVLRVLHDAMDLPSWLADL
ncbi:MAG: type II toxin-antitoxin system RelE/ParE family toxin [Caulobacteraceae bacterium]